MSASTLDEAMALADAGQVQKADAIADVALADATARGDGSAILDWVGLSVRLCDRLGRVERAVENLALAAMVLRGEGEHETALALEVESAMRATTARLGDWEPRLTQATLRLVDEEAIGWSLEAVRGVLDALAAAGQQEIAADAAGRLAHAWASQRNDLDCAHLAVVSARNYEAVGRFEKAMDAWKRASQRAQSLGLPEPDGWSDERERCFARLNSGG